MRETAGHPVVLAHHPGPGGDAPHLLFYGHYDVQPADPLALWTSPPFEPALVEGPHGKRVVARGAVDDKGQTMLWLEAFRAYHAVTGGLPVRVTVLVEGEEEVGSPSLSDFLAANRDALRADVVVISDTGMWDIATPAITTRLRGSTYVEAGAARRGAGSAFRPVRRLGAERRQCHGPRARRLARSEGRVQVPGFYDGVTPLPPELLASWDASSSTRRRFSAGWACARRPANEGRSSLERLWAGRPPTSPACGAAIPAPARRPSFPPRPHAKVSFRLVPGQDPGRRGRRVAPICVVAPAAGGSATFDVMFQGRGLEIPSDNRWVRAAGRRSRRNMAANRS